MAPAFVFLAFVAAQDPCALSCPTPTTLTYCDGEAEATLDCTTVADGSTCAELSPEWGLDCLLPAGAACDPGYGFGKSRCAGGGCVDGVCVAGAANPGEPILDPTAGTGVDISPEATSTSCLGAGCPTAGGLPFLALFVRRRRLDLRRRDR